MTDMRHMDADLVRPARRQPAGQQGGGILVAFLQRVARQGLATAKAGNRLPLAVSQITIEGGIDFADMGFRHAPDKSVVLAFERAVAPMLGKLRRKRAMRLVVLGDD